MFTKLLKIKNHKLEITFFVFLMVFVFNVNTVSAAIIAKPSNLLTLSTGLIGYWTFDGKNMITNVADSSGGGNNGRLVTVTSTTTTVGVIGQAYVSPRDTSTNAYIDTGSNYIGTNSFSICFWAKMNTNTGNFLYNSQTIMTTNSSNRFGLTRDNTASGSVSAVDAIVLNKWQYYCATSNTVSNTHNLYVNGVLNGDADQSSGAPGAGVTNVRLLVEGAGSTVDGAVDDMRIYNRVLSANEIKSLYSSGSNKFSSTPNSGKASLNPGLVGHWTFDGKNMITNVADSSGQGNNGNLTGFTSTTTTVGKIGQALSFASASSQYVNIGTSLSAMNISGDLTLSAWIRPNDVGSTVHSIISNSDGAGNNLQWNLEINRTAGKIGFIHGGSGGSYVINNSDTTLTAGVWQHIVAVRTGSSGNWIITFYLNGASDGGGTGIADPQPNSAVNIGQVASVQYADGAIDDVRVFNKALSANEVIKLYQQGK